MNTWLEDFKGEIDQMGIAHSDLRDELNRKANKEDLRNSTSEAEKVWAELKAKSIKQRDHLNTVQMDLNEWLDWLE